MSFEIFMGVAPGLEGALLDEVRGKGFKKARAVVGGVTVLGGWSDVWRANLWVRGASRVLARVARFRVVHLNDLEDLARGVSWGDYIHAGARVAVEVSCSRSKIYHSGAALERIGRAVVDVAGATLGMDKDSAAVRVMVRIDRDICTISLDTSGDLLHRRGFKVAVNRAPMRETMAALFLQQCGFTGAEPVYDPMCGSGTFVIEAAEVAARLNPGRGRSFAFEALKVFDDEARAAWDKMRSVQRQPLEGARFYGSDRDDGAVAMARGNADRAGVGAMCDFQVRSISDIAPPCDQAGLMIVNPPYGKRVSDKAKLVALYQKMGAVLQERFTGWRVGIVTSEGALAKATGLSFLPAGEAVQHGGMRIKLYRTDVLG